MSIVIPDPACPAVISGTPQKLPPTAAVIFGATGDLTHRKIIPAFYHLAKNGLLPDDFAIIGFARRPKSDDEFRKDLGEALRKYSHTKPVDEEVWTKLAAHIYYFQGELDQAESYKKLAEKLNEIPESAKIAGNFLFYLATSPEYFGPAAKNLAAAGLSSQQDGVRRRLIVEKPFGEDLKSAEELNKTLQAAFAERDIFRIDHYLGKETVQNLIYFRFANAIYEPLWNRLFIDHVQITVAEQVGVESRGGYYDNAGAARDMLQNHMFQLFTLTAMEPPASLDAESIRDEKVKVLRSIPTPSFESLQANTVRAQYGGGYINNKAIPAYRQEEKVAHTSLTETFVAARFEVDNWRWHGVPFYLRTGKALATSFTEINIIFKRPPSALFAASSDDRLRRNTLRIRIQPNEGISIKFNAKVPGKSEAEAVDMAFSYRGGFDHYLPEAYERLIVDAIIGESTLFTRSDEVEEAWRLVDSVKAAWAKQNVRDLPLYACGSMGPVESDLLLEKTGRYWVRPKEMAT
jgi:glucose-6-phosphate 1-dehydrogenase